MRLDSLELWNFKGVKHFRLDTKGQDMSIYADNKKGKTCIADSLPWLFYDLDSQGKTFVPKPLDLTGEAAHGIHSVVEATFIFDNGNDLTLKKSFTENWTKKHGTGKKIFEGHTTQYYINDMESSVRKKDYDDTLSKIASSTILKLLSNIKFFSEGTQKTKRKDDQNRWDWEKRRELLFELSDDMPTDLDIVQAHSTLARVPKILDGKSVEKRKGIIKERQKSLNKLLNELPIRVKEKERDIPDITGLNLPAIEKELKKLSKELAAKNEEIARIESGGEVAERIKKQREIEAEILAVENKLSAAQNQKEKVQREKKTEFEESQRKKMSALYAARDDEIAALEKIRKEIDDRAKAKVINEATMVSLRKDWHSVNDNVFNEQETICPTCGQIYPEDRVQEIKETFNKNKAEGLRSITEKGKEISKAVDEQNELADLTDVPLYEKQIKELTEKIDTLNKQVFEPDEETPENEDEKAKKKDILKLESDLMEIKLNIEGLEANNQDAIEIVKSEIATLTRKQAGINCNKQTLKEHTKTIERIAEIGAQQKKVAGDFEELEDCLFILNEFTKTKAAMVEGKISEKFQITDFKLFNLQVNGQIDDCCKVKHQGICWDAGLNNSSQTYVGVDVINTLSKHYGLTLPIIIDNAESVLHAIPSKSQIIKLVASETVQCVECKWTGLHNETTKELDGDNVVIQEMCPKCNGTIKEYSGMVARKQ